MEEQYYVVGICRDCTYIGFQGCFEGFPWLENNEPLTKEEANTLSDQKNNLVEAPYQYEVVHQSDLPENLK